MFIMKQITLLYIMLAFFCSNSIAQSTGPYGKNIHSVKLYKPGDQTSFPMIVLNSSDVLELHFDDLDADVKNYYYFSVMQCRLDSQYPEHFRLYQGLSKCSHYHLPQFLPVHHKLHALPGYFSRSQFFPKPFRELPAQSIPQWRYHQAGFYQALRSSG
jgi:hypothetical protein